MAQKFHAKIRPSQVRVIGTWPTRGFVVDGANRGHFLPISNQAPGASCLYMSRSRTQYTSTSAGAKNFYQSKIAPLASAMTSIASSYHVFSPPSGHAAASADARLAMLVHAFTY
jgi:hypothetical protein